MGGGRVERGSGWRRVGSVGEGVGGEREWVGGGGGEGVGRDGERERE